MKVFTGAILVVALLGIPACNLFSDFVIHPVDDGLFRGRAPTCRADFEKLRQAGVRTVIDLRAFRPLASSDEARLAAEYGIVYRNESCPALPWAMDKTDAAYQKVLDTKDYPLFVHCQQNRDRCSVIMGLYRVQQQGWQPQDAYDEMKRFGLRGCLPFFHSYFWKNCDNPSGPRD